MRAGKHVKPGGRGKPSAPGRPPKRVHSAPRTRNNPNAAAVHVEPERLQKVLARAGLASRREAEDWIRAERITVNGKVATLGDRAGPADEVRLDGRIVRQRAADGGGSVFICHRSPGENLKQPASDDSQESPGNTSTSAALLERLPRRAGRRFIPVSPMPRIDGGLELVTSDGELAARLQRSVHRLSSEFSVRVMGELNPDQIARILQGTLDSGETLTVARCEASGGEGANRWYALEARGASGKDVRQLVERQGAMVSRVLRTKLGSLVLERTLARGRFRPLTIEELTALMGSPGSGS